MEPTARDVKTDTVTFQVTRDPYQGGIVITAHLADTLLHDLRPQIFNAIISRMVDIWIEKKAAQLLELISPLAVANAVKEAVAKRVLSVLK